MNEGKTVFSQVMEFLPMYEFRKCVERYHGDYKVLSFSCLDQFLCMAFAQMTFRESLRDIQACLRSKINKLYHMGIRGQVSRNTLSNANNQRDWRIYADLAMILIHRARKLYINEPFGIDLNNTVYALDSTTIDLCLALFPWARFRKNKGAVKLHTLLDLRGNIPSFIDITDGKVHDVNVLDILIFEAGSFYIMDRGYIDFKRLYALHQSLAFFVTRAKSNLKCRWQVELFFKWIKAFFGTSENAVKTQVWIAVSIYVLIAIIRKQMSLEPSLYTILQILSVNIFEKEAISRLLTTKELDNDNSENDNQLKLF